MYCLNLPVVREPYHRIFQSLERIPHVHKQFLALRANSVRVIPLRERPECQFQPILVYIRANVKNLVKVGRHRSGALHECVHEI